MSAKCYKCKATDVVEEYSYCSPCEALHKHLCAELDARPKVKKEKKVKEELFPIKEIKQGIPVTTYISREDAFNMGIKLST